MEEVRADLVTEGEEKMEKKDSDKRRRTEVGQMEKNLKSKIKKEKEKSSISKRNPPKNL